jgi:hypothetical protein
VRSPHGTSADVQRIFGYAGGCIQSNPIRLGLVQWMFASELHQTS